MRERLVKFVRAHWPSLVLVLIAILAGSALLRLESRVDQMRPVVYATDAEQVDFLEVVRDGQTIVVGRNPGESDEDFIARAAAIAQGEIDPFQTYLCMAVTGCAGGVSSVNICVARAPGVPEGELAERLATLKAQVCAQFGPCTGGCS